MSFHKDYSDLINQLPPSLVQESWRRLTTRKRNPLSIEEVQSINPIVEAFLKHEVELYNQKKQRKRCTPIISRNAIAPSHEVAVSDNKSNYNEDEFNHRLNQAIDEMHQKFTKSTHDILLSIKEQKEKEIEQIRNETILDMAKKSKELFVCTLKKYIHDGTIYSLIHELEDMDGKSYPDRIQGE